MFDESNMQEQPGSAAANQAPEPGSPTVITIGLTPPMIGGGLVLAYLGVRRMAAGRAGSNGSQDGPGPAKLVGTAAESATGAVRNAGEAAGRTAGTARERVVGATQTLRSAASGAAGGAAERARGLQETVSQNPGLALGIGMGIGALVALAVPASRQERELLKPASETVVKQVQAGAQETAEKVRLVAEDAGTSIRESANQVGLIPVAVGSDGR